MLSYDQNSRTCLWILKNLFLGPLISWPVWSLYPKSCNCAIVKKKMWLFLVLSFLFQVASFLWNLGLRKQKNGFDMLVLKVISEILLLNLIAFEIKWGGWISKQILTYLGRPPSSWLPDDWSCMATKCCCYFKWCLNETGFASRNAGTKSGKVVVYIITEQ